MMMQRALPLTDFEKQLLQEIKAFRANPSSYAAILEQTRKPHYSGNVLTVDRVRMRTEEGVAACDEAIAYLKGLRGALPELELEYGLVIAAKESCKENGSQGAFDTNAVEKLSHLGALDGGQMRTLGEACEVSAFGAGSARDTFLGWLIGDGDPDRSSRKHLCNAKWKKVGVAAGPHASECEMMVIVTLATHFKIDDEVAKKLSSFAHLWSTGK
ncbi:hypothetical protein QOT17_009838 [Balamuthia mandrillaris]